MEAEESGRWDFLDKVWASTPLPASSTASTTPPTSSAHPPSPAPGANSVRAPLFPFAYYCRTRTKPPSGFFSLSPSWATTAGASSSWPWATTADARLLVSIQLETVCIHQANLGEDERSAATAAETLVSIFATNSAWMTDRLRSNSQTDPPEGNHKPLFSLDSFEESILNLEEMKDDGESTPVRQPDKDTQSCGTKLKRGRGLRDGMRCDDLHAIGYEIRETRSRRSSGEQGTPSMRTRLPRRWFYCMEPMNVFLVTLCLQPCCVTHFTSPTLGAKKRERCC